MQIQQVNNERMWKLIQSLACVSSCQSKGINVIKCRKNVQNYDSSSKWPKKLTSVCNKKAGWTIDAIGSVNITNKHMCSFFCQKSWIRSVSHVRLLRAKVVGRHFAWLRLKFRPSFDVPLHSAFIADYALSFIFLQAQKAVIKMIEIKLMLLLPGRDQHEADIICLIE